MKVGGSEAGRKMPFGRLICCIYPYHLGCHPVSSLEHNLGSVQPGKKSDDVFCAVLTLRRAVFACDRALFPKNLISEDGGEDYSDVRRVPFWRASRNGGWQSVIGEKNRGYSKGKHLGHLVAFAQPGYGIGCCRDILPSRTQGRAKGCGLSFSE